MTFKDYFELNLIDQSIIYCKLINYISFVLPSFNSWMLVIVSIDRFFSIAKPTRYSWRKKTSIQITFSIVLIKICCIVYAPAIFNTKMKSNNYTNQTCDYQPVMLWFNTSYLIIAPFILMMIFTIFTLISLFNSRRKNRSSSTIKSKDIKFAITSLSLNLLFFIFGFPVGLYLILQNEIQYDIYINQFLLKLFLPLFYINYSDLFLISIIANSIFREELLLILNELKLKRKII